MLKRSIGLTRIARHFSRYTASCFYAATVKHACALRVPCAVRHICSHDTRNSARTLIHSPASFIMQLILRCSLFILFFLYSSLPLSLSLHGTNSGTETLVKIRIVTRTHCCYYENRQRNLSCLLFSFFTSLQKKRKKK